MNGALKLLSEHGGGATQEEISDAIRDVVAAVTDEGKAGTVTVTISIKPLGKGNGLSVGIECKAKPPKQAAGVSVFFADGSNNLQRQDPRQSSMELREIIPAGAAKALA